jgi:UrcA family protein
MNIKTVLIALTATVAAISPAQAGTTKVSTTVEVADLDLTTAEGAAALEHRIDKAVRQLCGSYERRDGVGDRPFTKCVRAARTDSSFEAILAAARKGTDRQATAVAAR